jgi:hypothetical protein
MGYGHNVYDGRKENLYGHGFSTRAKRSQAKGDPQDIHAAWLGVRSSLGRLKMYLKVT